MDAAGALNPKTLLLALMIADVMEKILLPILAIDKDVPPKTLLLVPVVADIPLKVPLHVLVTLEKVLLKKPFSGLVTTAVVQPKVLLTVPVTADVRPKILLPELVKADVLPKGTIATLSKLVSWVLASVADNVETDVYGSPKDANLKTGVAVKGLKPP